LAFMPYIHTYTYSYICKNVAFSCIFLLVVSLDLDPIKCPLAMMWDPQAPEAVEPRVQTCLRDRRREGPPYLPPEALQHANADGVVPRVVPLLCHELMTCSAVFLRYVPSTDRGGWGLSASIVTQFPFCQPGLSG
jgi:hypothetical protein